MTAEARAEAERRYPAPTLPGDNIGLRVGFVEGAEWKGAQWGEVIEAARAWRRAAHTGDMRLFNNAEDELMRALSGVESSDEGEADARR
jgi:hypothetical protein